MCICISCFGRSGVYCMYQEIGTDASPAEMSLDLPQVGVFTALLLVKPSDAVLLLLQGSLMIRCLASAVQRLVPCQRCSRIARGGMETTNPGEVRV